MKITQLDKIGKAKFGFRKFLQSRITETLRHQIIRQSII